LIINQLFEMKYDSKTECKIMILIERNILNFVD